MTALDDALDQLTERWARKMADAGMEPSQEAKQNYRNFLERKLREYNELPDWTVFDEFPDWS